MTMENDHSRSSASGRATPFQRATAIVLTAAALVQMISVAFIWPGKKK